MTIKTKTLDIAEYLETEEDISDFLSEASASGDTHHLVHCLNIAARARGMTEVANQAGLTRASLYKSLNGDSSPKLETIAKVLNVFGCRLSITHTKPTG
jgi:probable addiction module antidote protein